MRGVVSLLLIPLLLANQAISMGRFHCTLVHDTSGQHAARPHVHVGGLGHAHTHGSHSTHVRTSALSICEGGHHDDDAVYFPEPPDQMLGRAAACGQCSKSCLLMNWAGDCETAWANTGECLIRGAWTSAPFPGVGCAPTLRNLFLRC